MIYDFRIDGDPVAQGRGRACLIKGRARVIDPAKSRNWKAYAGEAAKIAGVKPIEGPVSISVTAVWKRPKSAPKRLGEWRLPRPSRPDADNVGKAVMDALCGIAYEDDAAVVSLYVVKMVAAEGEMPHVAVRVEPWEPR